MTLKGSSTSGSRASSGAEVQMRRIDLEKQLREIAKRTGATLKEREGANHTIFEISGKRIPVPRHREINEHTASRILKDAKLAASAR